MKLFTLSKDGGPLSKVWGYFLIEWKKVFSIVLLRFEDGSREAYHNHAFNAWSWLLSGKLIEDRIDGMNPGFTTYVPSFKPIFTSRDNMHRVTSEGRTWVLSFRGPWINSWQEHSAKGTITLTHGRKEIANG